MHTVAARTERKLLPAIVAALLERNDQRRGDRALAWRTHSAQTRAREAALERITVTRQQTAQRRRGRDQGYGLELWFGENAYVTTTSVCRLVGDYRSGEAVLGVMKVSV